jgi:hypothetical protein
MPSHNPVGGETAIMQSSTRSPGTNRLLHVMSEHRFRFTLLICALVLVLSVA